MAGCGYVGEPLPPLANVPARAVDLAAVQRGGRIIAQFTVPQVTTENFPIPGIATLDLRVGTADQFTESTWASQAKQVLPATVTGETARYEIPAAGWLGKEVILGARVVGGNGKAGGWSNFVIVPVVPTPEKPVVEKPVATAAGVKVSWRAQGPQFRVFRKPEGATDFALAATVERPEWVDPEMEFGKRITYLVQTIVKVGDNKFAESDLSEAVELTPVDTFPPAAPLDLHATAGAQSIELSWEPNAESDLAGYRVYRAAPGGGFVKVADLAPVPSYSDTSAERGKSYRYAVTAIDRAGNESQRSAAAEVVRE